jgi:PadR family transcriptional regulator PadR
LRDMGGEALKGHLELLLLTSIEAGATHGYAIAKELKRASEGTFDLPDGTIYPALRRLCDMGLLTSSWSDGGIRRRRVYALTPKGRKALEQQLASWERFERGVRGVLALTAVK